MLVKNTSDQYGLITKTFHWLMAVMIIILVLMGLFMGDLPEDSMLRFQAYMLHKSFGALALAFVLCRIGWHLISKTPEQVESLPAWQKKAAVALHYLLYVCMLAMPLSGLAMTSAAGRKLNVFGLFDLPDLMPPNKDLSGLFWNLHDYSSTLLIIILGLHIAAAIKHHFIDKDTVLKRMLPVFFCLFIASFSTTATAADPEPWIVDYSKSSITFRAWQMGKEFQGSFPHFTADITFDPDNLLGSRAEAVIDITSVQTQSSSRDETLTSDEWFNVAKFPTARFQAASFRKTGRNNYEVIASLTLRNLTLPITMPFTLDIQKDSSGKNLTAVMDAVIVLDRSHFNLGIGKWADPSVIANEVPVTIHLVASEHRSRR